MKIKLTFTSWFFLETKTKQNEMIPFRFGLERNSYKEVPPFLIMSQEVDQVRKKNEETLTQGKLEKRLTLTHAKELFK